MNNILLEGGTYPMLDLFTKYSITDIIMFLVILAVAIKQCLDFFDWVRSKISNRDNKKIKKYENEKDLFAELEFFKTEVINTQKALEKMQKQIDLLIESDKDDIKAYITKEHHYFCYEKGWIDDYSLDCIEKRYGHYVEEKGNSFVKSLMIELRSLPKQDK